MIYDYSGFPPHSYEIQYNAPGADENEAADRIFHHTGDMTGITVSNYKFG